MEDCSSSKIISACTLGKSRPTAACLFFEVFVSPDSYMCQNSTCRDSDCVRWSPQMLSGSSFQPSSIDQSACSIYPVSNDPLRGLIVLRNTYCPATTLCSFPERLNPTSLCGLENLEVSTRHRLCQQRDKCRPRISQAQRHKRNILLQTRFTKQYFTTPY
jgi:hypothetical protein